MKLSRFFFVCCGVKCKPVKSLKFSFVHVCIYLWMSTYWNKIVILIQVCQLLKCVYIDLVDWVCYIIMEKAKESLFSSLDYLMVFSCLWALNFTCSSVMMKMKFSLKVFSTLICCIFLPNHKEPRKYWKRIHIALQIERHKAR